MGKRIVYFSWYLSIAVSCLFHTQTKAQDTIVLKDGRKIIGEKVYVKKKVYYRNFKDTAEIWHSFNMSEIFYIHYSSGDKEIITNTKDSAKTTRIKYYSIYFNACIGYPDIWIIDGTVFEFETTDGIIYKPYYGFSVDFKFDKNLSIGASYGVESVSRDENFDSGTTYNHRYTQAMGFSLNLRGLYNVSFLKICSAYIGLGFGFDTYNEQISNTKQPTDNETVKSGSYLAFAGIRVLLKDKIGIHLEAAYGVPYMVEAGITYAINFKLSETK